VYQSADFRLTDLTTKQIITDRSSKIVSLTYESWDGLVTYAGMGRWSDRDTSSWISAWTSEPTEPTFEEVARHLASRMSETLRGLGLKGHDRRHTFTLASFQGGRPVVAVVSNFQDVFNRNRPGSEDELRASFRYLGSRTRRALLIITGYSSSVSSDDRTMLERLGMKHPDDAGQIRRLLQEVNARAAKTVKAKGMISEDCEVASYKSDGSGTIVMSDGGRPLLTPGQGFLPS
jgi:hypothetical protein